MGHITGCFWHAHSLCFGERTTVLQSSLDKRWSPCLPCWGFFSSVCFSAFSHPVAYFFTFTFCSSQLIPLQSPATALGNTGLAEHEPETLGPCVLGSGWAVAFGKRAGGFQPCTAPFSRHARLLPPPFPPPSLALQASGSKDKELRLSGWET